MRRSNYWLPVLISIPMLALAGTQEGIEAFRTGQYSKAEALLRPEAEKGDRVAQYFLAATLSAPLEAIQGGRSPRENDPRQQEVHEWLGKAARQGYVKAMFEYALDFDDGYGTQPDFEAALEWTQKAVDAGDSYAMIQLHRWYQDGHIVAPDAAKAAELQEKAFASSPRRAEVEETITSLRAHSDELLKKRATQDPDRVARDLRDAEAGDAAAARRVAANVMNSKDGTRDCARAAYWLERAGDLGDASAYSALGHQYFRGTCVKQDFAQARLFLAKAIERSADIDAHHTLATMKFFGHGQARDYEGAFVHLRVINMLDPNRFKGNRVMLNYARRQLSPAQLASAQQEITVIGNAQLPLQAQAHEKKSSRRPVMSGGDPKDPKRWSYHIDLVDESGSCARSGGPCGHVAFMTQIRIHNPETGTLDCRLAMPVMDVMYESSSAIARRYIVRPRSEFIAPPESEIATYDPAKTSLTCTRVAHPSVAAGTCTVEAPAWANPNQYFEGNQASPRSGDVMLALTFARAPASPHAVAIKASSGAADFDAAALAFAKDTTFETNCLGEPVPFSVTLWR